jgi:hypothetical protein
MTESYRYCFSAAAMIALAVAPGRFVKVPDFVEKF